MQIGGARTTACPHELVRPVADCVRAWGLLARHGVLPIGAGWLDQTQAFVEAVAVLDSEVAEIQADGMRRGQ